MKKIIIISGKARHGKDTLTNILIELLAEKGFKGLRLAYGDYIKMFAKKISNWDGTEETKPRELLQELGTEVIRKQIDELFYVKRMVEDIKVYSYFFDYLIISNARVTDEIDYIKEHYDNVISIRINRRNYVSDLTSEQMHHLSEIGLDNYHDFDLHISNDGSIDDLKVKAKEVLESEIL